MADKWVPLPIYAPVYTNVDETALRNGQAALENGFVTEARGHSRFPGLKLWATLPTGGRVYPTKWRGDLLCTTSLGRVYLCGQDRTIQDVTGVLVTGGERPTFAATDEQVMIAAGGPIVTLREAATTLLSDDAPETTHVGYIDAYAMAIEPGSARFRYSDAGLYSSWPGLNTETANAQSDALVAMLVNDFAEVLLCGPLSIEQWERNTGGTSRAFFRRWTVPTGLYSPYAIARADNAVFLVNKQREIARVSGQLAAPISRPIQLTLEEIDDWSGAWMAPADIGGQRFIILQMPEATNAYGARGVTIAYDYAQKRYSFLYGFDEAEGVPSRWYGWGIEAQWTQTFVGGDDGRIYTFDADTFAQDAGPMHMLGRTGHFDLGYRAQVNDLRIRMRRGQDTTGTGVIQVRVNRDNRGWLKWLSFPIGAAGDRHMHIRTGPLGTANAWQFEYRVIDAMPIEIVEMAIRPERVGG